MCGELTLAPARLNPHEHTVSQRKSARGKFNRVTGGNLLVEGNDCNVRVPGMMMDSGDR